MLSLSFLAGTLFPFNSAYASVFSGMTKKADAQTEAISSQTAPAVLTPNMGPSMFGTDSKVATTDVVISNNAALTPTMGPAGNAVDAADDAGMGMGITFYTVQPGDTVPSVAKMFGITESTLRQPNNLSVGAKLKPDDLLIILPRSGIQHTVKKGETVKSLAKKYSVDASEILFYNDLSSDSMLTVGDVLMIPDATFDGTADSAPVKKPTTKPNTGKKTPVDNTPITIHPAHLTSKIDLGGAILRPVDISMSRVSQSLHGWDYSAVDIAAKKGTPVVAPADGTILYLRKSGYNDGYGMYVILLSNIDGNRVEFIMAHMSDVDVEIGQSVSRGQKIGEVGRTGNATGDHLHFEVRGAKNPLGSNSRYTGDAN